MALDQIWTTAVPNDWEVAEANRLLRFFTGKGIDDYGATFTLDGIGARSARDNALVAVNGVTAMIATKLGRASVRRRGLGAAAAGRHPPLLLRDPGPDGAADAERAIHRLVAGS